MKVFKVAFLLLGMLSAVCSNAALTEFSKRVSQLFSHVQDKPLDEVRNTIRDLLERAEQDDDQAKMLLLSRDEEDGSTLLHWAASRDDRELCKLLLRAGLDINAVFQEDVSVLSIASLYGHPQMVDWLLQEGAESDTASFYNAMQFNEHAKFRILERLVRSGTPLQGIQDWFEGRHDDPRYIKAIKTYKDEAEKKYVLAQTVAWYHNLPTDLLHYVLLPLLMENPKDVLKKVLLEERPQKELVLYGFSG